MLEKRYKKNGPLECGCSFMDGARGITEDAQLVACLSNHTYLIIATSIQFSATPRTPTSYLYVTKIFIEKNGAFSVYVYISNK